MNLFIFKDPNTNNLWIRYEERINIGYWLPDLFGSLSHGAGAAEWGGEVFSSKLERAPHTETHMGNENFPDWATENSGYFKRVRILDISLNLKFPEWMMSYEDEYWCYRSDHASDYIVDPEFYFGGPGRNDMCDGANGKVNFKEVDRKLKQLNKPAVKTIQSEDGDIIDCVDIYKQPAFDHPALKNHVIQMKPNFDFKEEKPSTTDESSKLVVSQTWRRSGSCPEETVPIRRIRREDLLRANSIHRFGRKPQEIDVSKSNTTNQEDGHFPFINNTKLNFPTMANRSAAILVTLGYNYIGAKGDINVWNPNVEADDEFTTAQIWLKAGPWDNFESLESGWTVNPQLYGDRRTRFFAHWTKDSYKTTGCFDLTCSGFVLTGTEIALGGAIEPISSHFGQQYKITVGIYMDPKTSNWWLKYGKDIPIGYWPAATLMSYLKQSSTLVEWGGQVYSPNVKKKPHTKTPWEVETLLRVVSAIEDCDTYPFHLTTFGIKRPKMAKLNISNLFLMLLLSYLSDGANGKVSFKEVDRKLKQLNKPAVKTIQSEDGDIIDCVDIYKQPAFDNPALKNHVIQMKPSFDFKEEKPSTTDESSKLVVAQTWQRSGSCPEGTVPIRRIRMEDLLRADSIDQFGRKPKEIVSKSNKIKQKDGYELPSMVDESAATLVTLGSRYIGAKGDINVWNPYVESVDDFTTAQIWVKGGPIDDYESLESGWTVFPNLYGDNRTRFFIYWTTGSTGTSGCFDHNCDGFVQISPEIALGAAIEPLSREYGQQYYITIGIYKDPKTNNWWLKYGDGIVIGYWAAATTQLYFLNDSSMVVQWGGMVYSQNVKKTPHTTTAMGSGQFGEGLYGKACYVQNIAVVDYYSRALEYPRWLGTWADETNCYTGSSHFPDFYFGGPGRCPNCNCP
ncbi:oleosin 1-like [Hibiscus syriacus]|uniref:Oleosin 1-like n=1 Tax=Hibiscus syriacus TaxID=106335 RepID=A0A6A3A2D9_HIBSY|nr:oleosin 1-like [Hibiscus syriacus]